MIRRVKLHAHNVKHNLRILVKFNEYVIAADSRTLFDSFDKILLAESLLLVGLRDGASRRRGPQETQTCDMKTH